MARTSRRQRYNSWRVFQQDLGALGRWLEKELDSFLTWMFAFNPEGARRRSLLFFIVTIGLWIVLALLAHPPGPGIDPIITQIFYALFATDVLRHFVVLTLALWLGLRLAAVYLDDIFELKDVTAAEKFIRQAAFPGYYNRIVIKGGAVAQEHKKSPIVRIGGPGVVDVHLENTALFEKIEGTPHIIEPSRTHQVALDGFERLRSVIDLRDQAISLDVDGRTQDGIPVQAKDVRLVFSVYRGPGRRGGDSGFDQPYPFTEKAIRDLVYLQGKVPWTEAMRTLIRSELRDFISTHTLSEFLTNADTNSSGADFFPRDQLTNLFYDFAAGFTRRAEERGVQLAWIGVGTWVTPSEIIPSRHLEAWKLSSEIRSLKSSTRLSRIHNESRLSELLRLVDDVLNTFYNDSQQASNPNHVMRSLILLYREKLRNAQELYKSAQQPVPPEVDEAIRRLSIIGGRWSGGKPGDNE